MRWCLVPNFLRPVGLGPVARPPHGALQEALSTAARSQSMRWASPSSVRRTRLCDWMASAAALVGPLVALMRERVLRSRAIHSDDTSVPFLERGRDKARDGHLWVYIGDRAHPYVVFDFTTHYRRDGPEQFLKGYAGYLQADALAQYEGCECRRRSAAPCRPRSAALLTAAPLGSGSPSTLTAGGRSAHQHATLVRDPPPRPRRRDQPATSLLRIRPQLPHRPQDRPPPRAAALPRPTAATQAGPRSLPRPRPADPRRRPPRAAQAAPHRATHLRALARRARLPRLPRHRPRRRPRLRAVPGRGLPARKLPAEFGEAVGAPTSSPGPRSSCPCSTRPARPRWTSAAPRWSSPGCGTRPPSSS